MVNEQQVLVCQRGARHRYAIPRMLEEVGLLAALYTDSTSYSFAGTFVQGLVNSGVKSHRLKSLTSRVPQGIPREKVFSSDRPLLSELTRGMVSPDLGATYKRWGLQGADVVYSMYGEDYTFLQWAKTQGAKIIVDVFVHPDTTRIVEEETLRIIGRGEIDASEIERQDDHSKRAFELADILLCPSRWVAQGVRDFLPECEGKIRILPYGSSIVPMEHANSPVPGRVFFAGRDALRKGLHYLAEAAHLVREKNQHIQVRVAGLNDDDISEIEYHTEINCIGTIPLHQMHEEFRRADVLVLPSLSEGQAGVILEAMACGCPVIATGESGVDFGPGCGVTVPARDAVALAEAIIEVVGDRERRKSLAEGALEQSGKFSMEAWKRRLVDVVREAGSI